MKLLPWLTSLTIIVIISYFYLNSREPTMHPGTSEVSQKLTASLTDARLIDYQGDKIKWMVNAERAELYENQNYTLFQKIHGRALHPHSIGIPTFFQADHGKMNSNSTKLIVWGNVKIQLSQGQHLFTDSITFDRSLETIYNRAKVRVESDNNTILADSMHYNLKSGLLTLPSPRIKLQFK